MKTFERYREFEAYLLVAGYLTIEDLNKEIASVGDVLERFPFEVKDQWIRRALQSFNDMGLAKGRMHTGPMPSQHIFLTAEGFKEAERLLDDGLQPESADRQASGLEPATIDSAEWTGISRQQITPANAEAVRGKIVDAIEIIESEDLSNEEKSQSLSFLRAAQELTEAPEPPSEMIWELIGRAGSVCGIAGLFLSLFLLS